jgi:PAS domain S-box-containing protein
VDVCVPDPVRAQGTAAELTARLLALNCLAVVVWGPLYAGAYVVLSGRWTVAAGLLLATVGVGAAMVLLRWTASVPAASHWMIASLMAAGLWAAGHSGGIGAPSLPWLAAIPVFAHIFVGARGAVGWTLLSLSACVGMYGLEQLGVSMPQHLSRDAMSSLWLLSLAGLSVLLFQLFYLYGGVQRWLLQSEQQREQTFRNLVDHLPDGLCAHRDGTIVYVNQVFADLLGYSKPDDMIGMNVLSLFPETETPAVRADLERLQEANAVPIVDRSVQRRDGSTAVFEGSAVRGTFDGAPATIAVVRDATDRKRLQTQLMQMDRAIAVGTLAAGVAHEINNPLSYVLANVDDLVEQADASGASVPLGDPEVRAVLQDVRDGARRISRVVADLNTNARRPEKGAGVADVQSVLDFALKMANNEVRHRARLVCELDEVAPVAMEESSLGQVLLNLCINAAHAIPEGAVQDHEIRIASYEQHGGVVIEVCDTGEGMSEETRARAVDPFFTTKGPSQGTGLGLTICRNLLDAAGGELQIDSERGVGTTIRIWLPVAARTEAADTTAEERPAPSSDVHRLLIVDDEPRVRSTLKRLLGRRFEVSVADSGHEALEWLRNDAGFDAILCDLLMPDLPGVDLHAELARRAPWHACRIVFMTGGAFTDRTAGFVEQTDRPVVRKPFDVDELVRSLNQVALQAGGPQGATGETESGAG